MPIITGGKIIEGARQRVSQGVLLGSPALGAINAVHAAITLGAGSTVTTGITNPAVPRNLTITGVGAGATGNVVISGTNMEDVAMSETIALAGASTVVGNRAFKTVTSIVVPPDSGATGETVAIGTGAKLGLPERLTRNTVTAAYLNGVREATAPTVAVSATVLESNTVQLASALNGTPVVVDYYVS